MVSLEEACNSLFSDPQLNELLEINKSSSDLLDLLSPRENQHSDILAWCLNSREGHDQGDTVLKDFLIEVYKQSTDSEPGDRLFGKGYTRDFVRHWTPGRIATSSFGSAIFIREYSLSGEGRGKSRIDLLIIDPDQKFIVVVENKAGAKLTQEQLDDYLNGIDQRLLKKSKFRDYLKAFVALDRDYDPETEEENTKNASPDQRWVRFNYEWLTAAAKRAGHAIKRGNQAAVLLRSYCLRQSSKIEYSDDQTRGLIHALAERYLKVLKELKVIRETRSKPEQWDKYQEDSSREYLLRMYMQNPMLWDQLIDLRPIDILDAQIRGALDYLEDDNAGLWRIYSAYRTSGADALIGPDGHWPLYIQVKHTNEKSDDEPRFRVGIKFRPQYLPEEDKTMEKLAKTYTRLSKSRIQEKGKWLELVEGLDSKGAKNKVLEMACDLCCQS